MTTISLQPKHVTEDLAIKFTVDADMGTDTKSVLIQGPVTVMLQLGTESPREVGQSSGSCLVQRPEKDGDSGEILSGALVLLQAPSDTKALLWPEQGEVKRLLIGPGGLQIEIEQADRLYRLQLVRWRKADTPAPRWQLLSVENEPPNEPPDNILTPKKRLDDLHSMLTNTLAPAMPQFFPREGAVFYDVVDGQVWEIVRPSWTLKVGGANWDPGYLAISADGSQFVFDDKDFEYDQQGNPKPLEPNFDAELQEGEAALKKAPVLYATSGATDVNPNHPFVWHYAPVKGGNGDYASAWVRYHLEQRPRLPQPTPAAAAEGGPRLSGPVEVRAGGWKLHLDSGQGRMRLTLTKTGDNWQKPKLQIEGATVRAWSPELQLCAEPLVDPAALPNAWDAEKHRHDVSALLSSVRLEFASDAQPSEPHLPDGAQPGALVAKWGGTQFKLTPQADPTADPAVVMTFVPGPEAGIDLVPWSGRNLLTKKQLVGAEPSDALPRPPDFNQGLMAVKLKNFVWNATGDIEEAEAEKPGAGGVMALLPWAEWQAKADAAEHTIHPFHRNLIQEHNEYAAGAEDLAKDAPDIGLGPEERRRRQQDDFKQAVRDGYAAAADSGLSVSGNGASNVSHWLPGSSAKATIAYVPASDDTGVPSLQAKLSDSDMQELSIKRSSQDGSPWLDTRLSWPLTERGKVDDQPKFEVERDLHNGAVHVADSSVPLVFQNGHITALTAHLLQTDKAHPRLAVILADDLNTINVWLPLATAKQTELTELHKADTTVKSLTFRQSKSSQNGKLAVGVERNSSTDMVLLATEWTDKGPQQPQAHPSALAVMANQPAAPIFVEDSDDLPLFAFAEETNVVFAKADSPSTRKSLDTGAVVGAFDLRRIDNFAGGFLAAALPNQDQVALYRWDNFAFETVASHQPPLYLSIGGNKVLTGVQILPSRNPTDSAGIYVIASINDRETPLIWWHVVWGQGAPPGKPVLAGYKITADITNLSLVQRPSAKSGEPNYWLLAATTEGDDLGAAEVLCWRLEWEAANQKDDEPRVVSFARGRGHQGSITALSVVSDDSGDFVVTGGQDGTARVWDPESGRELFRSGAPERFYDNLGVVRDLTVADRSKQDKLWRVDHLSILHKVSDKDSKRQAIRSLSTRGAVSLVDGDTNIRFTCLDLKLHSNEDKTAWIPLDNDEPAVALGTYGFFASLDGDKTPGQAAIRWPRLDGAPVFVTRLLSVTFKDDSPQPQTLTFTGVLGNPAALAAPRTEEAIPASVTEALAREALVTVKLELKNGTYQVASVDGAFYWRFALADQIPVEFGATAFPGRLARLVGDVHWDNRLVLTPRPTDCLASAFGRLWPLHSCPPLVVGSLSPLRFREQTEGDLHLQVYRTLRTGEATDPPAADLKRTRDTLLALTAAGTEARLFDAESGRRLRTISGRHRAVKLAPISANDAGIGIKAQGLIASEGGLVRFWQMIDPVQDAEPAEPSMEYREMLRFRLPAEVEAIDATYGQDDKLYFLFRCADGTARLWERGNGQELHTFTLPEAMVTAAAFAPLPDAWTDHWAQLSADNPELLLALGGSDGSVRVYGVSFDPDSATPKVVELRQFFDHGGAVGTVSLAIEKSVEWENEDELRDKAQGLFLLSCCEAGGLPSLREIVSSRPVGGFIESIGVQNNGASLANCTAGAIIPFKQDLHIILIAQQANAHAPGMLTLLKKTVINDTQNQFVAPLSGPVDVGTSALEVSATETAILIADAFRTNNQLEIQIRRHTGANVLTQPDGFEAVSSPPKMAVMSLLTSALPELLMTLDPEIGRVSLLSRNTDEKWKTVVGFNAANPVEVRDIAFGELIVPTVLLRLEDGHLGIWDPDLAYLERTEIEVSKNARFIYAYLGGEPHVRIVDGTTDRLWNLALGKPVRDLPADSAISAMGDPLSTDAYVSSDGSVWKLEIASGVLSVTKEGNASTDFAANFVTDLQIVFACAAFAGKGVRVSHGDEPVVVTVDREGNLQLWHHKAAEGDQPAAFIPKLSPPMSSSLDADQTATSVGVFMSGDRPCAIILSAEQVVLCDLEAMTPFRTWRLPAEGKPVLNWANLPMAVTAHGDQVVRLWDLTSGILRRELRELPADHLATVTVAGQPWVVAGGSSGVKALNLWTGEEKELNAGGVCTSVAAARVPDAGSKIALAVIAGFADQILTWADAAGVQPAPTPLSSEKASAVAVLVHNDSTYFAAAQTGGVYVWRTDQTGTRKITVEVPSQAGNIASLAIAPSFTGSQVAIAAHASGKVMLWDCYGADGATEWESSSWSLAKANAAVALAWTDDGPRLLAASKGDTCIFVPPSVLRVAAGETDPECYLQIKLDDFDVPDGNPRLLRGVITRGNKLDLILTPDEWGVKKSLHVQSGIIQDDYYGFRVEEPGENGGRGILVIWDAGPYERPALNGALLLEQAGDPVEQPATADVNTGGTPMQWSGRRVRFRELIFNLGEEEAVTAFKQQETLTWRLQGKLDGYLAELRIDEQTWTPALTPGQDNPPVAGFLRLTKEGQDIQGHVLLTVSGGSEQPTITLEPVVFLAQPVANAAVTVDALAEPFGVTRDDIVIATPDGADAIDLIPVARDDAGVQFVTLAGITFKTVNPETIPLNLTFSPEALRPWEKASIAVPQLAHRLAQGGRLRTRLPEGEPVVRKETGEWSPTAGKKLWLLAPLLQTAEGVLALSEGLAIAGIHPLGRQRIQTENVLAIHRTVSGEPPASIVNLMTISTLLGVGHGEGLVFDELRVRREIVRTGASGVIARRVLRGDGRIEYAFVNSPFYAHDEAVRDLEEKREDGRLQEALAAPAVAMDAGSSELPKGLDPRLIWRGPADVHLRPGVRYLPERSTPEADRAQVQAGQAPTRTFRFRLADLEEASQSGAKQRLQLGSATAFRQRLPIDRLAEPAISGTATFLPEQVVLGFGVDKPGAMAHHTLRVRDEEVESNGKSSTYRSLLDFAHREPQMIVRPTGTAVELMPVTGTGTTRDDPLTISWTEILGTAPIDQNLITDEVLHTAFDKAEKDSKPIDNSFELDAPLVQLVQRVGERIIPIGAEDPVILLPSSTDGRQPILADLCLVSRAKLDAEPTGKRSTTDDAGKTVLTDAAFQLLMVISSDTQMSSRLLAQALTLDLAGDNYTVYRFGDEFSKMLGGFNPSNDLKLNVIWWVKEAGEPTDASVAAAARVFPNITLRPIVVGPFAPKVAAVARYTDGVTGFLGNWRERTLFFGDAASAAGVKVEVKGGELVFSASQQVSIVTNYPLPDSIFLVKYLDEGQVVYAGYSVNG